MNIAPKTMQEKPVAVKTVNYLPIAREVTKKIPEIYEAAQQVYEARKTGVPLEIIKIKDDILKNPITNKETFELQDSLSKLFIKEGMPDLHQQPEFASEFRPEF